MATLNFLRVGWELKCRYCSFDVIRWKYNRIKGAGNFHSVTTKPEPTLFQLHFHRISV